MSPGEPRKQPGLVEVNLTPGEIADISEATSRPKTVRVKGYFRKGGTNVRVHYRSKPK